MEHFGRHEMTEVVEAEWTKSSGASAAEEVLRDAIRFPRGAATVIAEHEPVCVWCAMEGLMTSGDERERCWVEVDDMAPFSFWSR